VVEKLGVALPAEDLVLVVVLVEVRVEVGVAWEVEKAALETAP